MSGERVDRYFEVELPATWPPCPRCAARTRVAVASLRRRDVAFFCGGTAMHQLVWDGGDSRQRKTIGPDVFLPGGAFAGLIPAHYLPTAETRATQPFEIGARRQEWIRNEQRACAVCGIEPMRDWGDGDKLLDWLREADPDIYREVIAADAVPRSTWYGALVHANFDLISRVNSRVGDSQLQAARSIPADVLARHWRTWPKALRRIAVDTLAFGICARCIRAEDSRLPPRSELLRRHYQYNFDGSAAAAQADRVSWAPLIRLLDSLARSGEGVSALDAAR